MSIAEQERAKYAEIWAALDYSSRDWMVFAYHIAACIPKKDSILDVGCGDGRLIRFLANAGYDVYGLDITTAQIEGVKANRIFEAPLWETGLRNNAVDWVVSTDVLEHLPPEMVKLSIDELARIAKKGQVHRIATFRDNEYLGHRVHLSVHPIAWWEEQFSGISAYQDVQILER